MNEQKKLCPLKKHADEELNYCEGSKCAWWVNDVYSTENIKMPGMCSMVLLAKKNSDMVLLVKKNSDGQYIV